MSLFDDYMADTRFDMDFPYGIPNKIWHQKNGDVRVKDMSNRHILNCMRMVGIDDEWFDYFRNELKNRGFIVDLKEFL